MSDESQAPVTLSEREKQQLWGGDGGWVTEPVGAKKIPVPTKNPNLFIQPFGLLHEQSLYLSTH
jgi:hypothetical protein